MSGPTFRKLLKVNSNGLSGDATATIINRECHGEAAASALTFRLDVLVVNRRATVGNDRCAVAKVPSVGKRTRIWVGYGTEESHSTVTIQVVGE